ncbi:MAG: CZB domain-containing protein [Campylobacterota bacterium]|nr:CZB domain-containing protein [Campylobacterota bacterium]
MAFKTNNFKKLNEFSAFKVVDHNNCKMGKWINTQEQNGEKFTTTSSWNELKISHEQVHSNIQKYINENANHIPQNQLAQKALNIENNTLEVFEKLNNVLKVNCNNSHS